MGKKFNRKKRNSLDAWARRYVAARCVGIGPNMARAFASLVDMGPSTRQDRAIARAWLAHAERLEAEK